MGLGKRRMGGEIRLVNMIGVVAVSDFVRRFCGENL
jgi:hypothetical protein